MFLFPLVHVVQSLRWSGVYSFASTLHGHYYAIASLALFKLTPSILRYHIQRILQAMAIMTYLLPAVAFASTAIGESVLLQTLVKARLASRVSLSGHLVTSRA